MDKWIELLCNGGGIATGVIAGIVAAFVQFLISHFEHRFLQKAKKEEQRKLKKKNRFIALTYGREMRLEN